MPRGETAMDQRDAMANAWFSPAEKEGLQDYWDVYDRHYELLNERTLPAIKSDPVFGPMVAAMPEEVRLAQQKESRDRLRRAMAGDWAEYEENMRTQGAVYA